MSQHVHTESLQRNAAIVWARDLLDRQADWVILFYDRACASVTGITPTGSLAVLAANGRVLLDATVDELAAQPDKLRKVLEGKEIVTWDLPAHRLAMAQLGIAGNTVPANKLFGYSGAEAHCALLHYAYYAADACCGGGSQDKEKRLKVNRQQGSAAASAGKSILDLMYLLAGSRQSLGTADTGSPSWTGAHYKPPKTVAEKFRSFLGLE